MGATQIPKTKTIKVLFTLGMRGRRESIDDEMSIDIDPNEDIDIQIAKHYNEWLSEVNTGGYQILEEE